MKEKLVRVNSFLTVNTVATHNKSSHSKSPPTQFLVTGFNSKISLKEEKFYIKMTFLRNFQSLGIVDLATSTFSV